MRIYREEVTPSAGCNLHWHKRHIQYTTNFRQRVLIIHALHSTAIDRRWERLHSSQPPAKKLAPRTRRWNSIRSVSAVEHHTSEQYSKTGRINPRTHLTRSDWSCSTSQDFLNIHNFGEAALETGFSKVFRRLQKSVSKQTSEVCSEVDTIIINFINGLRKTSQKTSYHQYHTQDIKVHRLIQNSCAQRLMVATVDSLCVISIQSLS